jgi:hypothetical protein
VAPSWQGESEGDQQKLASLRWCIAQIMQYTCSEPLSSVGSKPSVSENSKSLTKLLAGLFWHHWTNKDTAVQLMLLSH